MLTQYYRLLASFLDTVLKLKSWHVGPFLDTLLGLILQRLLDVLGKQVAHAVMLGTMVVALWLFLIHCLETIWTLSIPSASCHKCTAFQMPTGTSFIDNKWTKAKRWWKYNHNCLSFKSILVTLSTTDRQYISPIKKSLYMLIHSLDYIYFALVE